MIDSTLKSGVIDVVLEPSNAVSVHFSSPTEENTSLRVTSTDGCVPATEYMVEEGSTECLLKTGELKNGVYQISLIEGGKVTESKKFKK